MTRFLLDSGNVSEYQELQQIAQTHSSEIWGATTNPSLIAKALNGKKVTQQEAFSVLQKQIVTDILRLVPGPVSAEVYATTTTTAEEMIVQGKEITTWDPRVVVKLPTTLEGFKARTQLRQLGITINNTLVFSQEQVFAITLHEKLLQQTASVSASSWPCFISPFVGRLDDIGLDGMSFIAHSIQLLKKYFQPNLIWMLESSIRSLTHLKAGIDLRVDLTTAPEKVYQEWFEMSENERNLIPVSQPTLQPIPVWTPSDQLLQITSLDQLFTAINNNDLNIQHNLTTKGIEKFVTDWSSILI